MACFCEFVDPFLQSLCWTRLPFAFDVATMRAEVLAVPESAWAAHFNSADYSGEWSSVALRSRSGRADDVVPMGHVEEYLPTPLLDSSPYLRAVVESFPIPLKSVRLLRLHSGSEIKEHRDPDLGLIDGELRIHVPIVTSDQVEFVVDNRRLMLRAGEAWYIDFSLPHRIRNTGVEHRVHLVIDGQLNVWAEALLRASARDLETESFAPSGMAEFHQFRDLVYADPLLCHELSGMARAEFLDGVLTAGQRFGLALDRAYIQSVWQANRREWNSRTI